MNRKNDNNGDSPVEKTADLNEKEKNLESLKNLMDFTKAVTLLNEK